MLFIRHIKDFPHLEKGAVVTLGNFDGVHLGHQALIKMAYQRAKAQMLPLVVILFEPHPLEFFKADGAPARLTRLREKIQLLSGLKVDYVLRLKFDNFLANVEAERFIRDFLVEKIHTKYLVIGDDFHFGRGRQGDIHLLQALSKQEGYQVEQLTSIICDNERASSSLVRLALRNNYFAKAQQLLGRPYSMVGRVIHGNKLGRRLGYPTANIPLKRLVSPLHGIFAVKVYLEDGSSYLGAASIGKRPTVNNLPKMLLEVYIFDFSNDIYGQLVKVEFFHKLRDEAKFATLDDLVQQMDIDVKEAKQFFKNQSL